MDKQVTVIGWGPVGRDTGQRLAGRGWSVRVAQRKAPANLPPGLPFLPCDLLDPASTTAAMRGAGQVVIAAGFAYEAGVWRQAWPAAMRNIVAAAEATGARVVFVDNLYMYGAQDAPLREDMPLADGGGKPAARAAATRIWQEAAAAGRIRLAALRSPEFYGPDVDQSHLGAQIVGPLARGGTGTFIVPADRLHDFAYVPDIARAVESLLEAGDDAFGQAWHVPCAPIRTPRAIATLIAEALGTRARLRVIPRPLMPLLGLAMPFVREMAEMRFQWDRPYRVDAGKFARRFWGDATPFEAGAAATARAARARAT